MERPSLARYAPLVGITALVAGFMLLPGRSDAQQAQRDICSASIERGQLSSFSSKTKTGRDVNTPLFERNKFLRVTIPDRYIERVVSAASGKAEPEKTSFVSMQVRKTVELGFSKVSAARPRATFECPAPVSEPPQPSPVPSKTAPPAPAEADSGKAAPPATAVPPVAPPAADVQKRGRVIQPGPEPSGKVVPPAAAPPSTAPPAKVELPALPRQISSGKGTKESPYVVTISKNRDSGTGPGATLVQVPFILQMEDENVGNVHFKVSFTVSQLAKSRQSETRGELAEIFRLCVFRKAAEKGAVANSTGVRDMQRKLPSQFQGVVEKIRQSDKALERYIDSN